MELDAEMVERARAELGLDSESDTAVVERALDAYLMGRLLDVTQARAGLSEQEAERLAYICSHGAAMESNHPTGGLLRPAGFEDRMGHQTPAAPDAMLDRPQPGYGSR